MSLPVRAASRIVVFDEDCRVLLLRFRDDDAAEFWATPGGGLETGESHEDAARRELLEELGLTYVTLGPAVWTRQSEFVFNGTQIRAHERFFCLHVQAAAAHPGSGLDLSEENVVGWKWWTLDELERTKEVLFPTQLARFARALLDDGPPVAPTDVGV